MYDLKLYEQKELDNDQVEELRASPTYPFVNDGDMLVYIAQRKKDSTKFVAEAISRYFYVEAVIYNLDTGLYSDVICINTLRDTQSVSIDRSILSTRCFEEMNTFGLVYNNKAVSLLLKYINVSESLAPVCTEYCSVGWVPNDKDCVFYGLESDEILHYIGEKDLSSCGESSDYIEAMNRLVSGRTGLEISLLTSLSSALVGLLSKSLPIETFLVHMYGNSSNGKTTALQLAASVWGNPAMGKGLLSSWNSTDNAIISKLNLNFGIVQCWDESSSMKRDFSSLLYSISQNTSKSRLSKSSQLQAEKKFCTTILSSGENCLLKASNQNLGLRVRILEFFNIPLTDSAEHSDEIKAFTAHNYGTLGAEFVKVLADLDTDSLLETLASWKKTLLSKIKLKTPITERLVTKYSILLTTASIAQQFLALNVNEENIVEFLLSHHNQLAVEANIGLRAYNCVLEWIVRNRGRLLTEECRSAPVADGTFLKGHTVALLDSVFKKILEENFFTDVDVIAHEFKNMGILRPEGKGLTARVRVNGMRSTCYRFVIKEFVEFEPLEFSHDFIDQDLSF